MANEKTLQVVVLHCALTTEQWQNEAETVIPKGFLCVEFAAGGVTRQKFGDGVNKFKDLLYANGDIDLSGYYTKSETDSAINTAISAIGTAVTVKGTAPDMAALPATGNKQGDLWFVENDAIHTGSGYAEYIWISNDWEFIGKNQSVDLTNYATVTYVDSQINSLAERIMATETDISAIKTELEDCLKSTDKLVLQCSL